MSASTYQIWCDMKQRCDNPNCKNYQYYGARGVSYDPLWKVFKNFYDDMGKKPETLTLGRIDNNKGYSKENCRWETKEQQNQNTRIRWDNQTGVKGIIYYKRRNIYIARKRRNHIIYNLYSGKSFELAKQAIESFEKDSRNDF